MALVRMFAQSHVAVVALEQSQRKPMLDRLEAARLSTNVTGRF